VGKDRYKHVRHAHCAQCNAIHRYVVYASARHRLRNQRCQSCGGELGRGANKRAVAMRKAEKSALRTRKTLVAATSGGTRSGRTLPLTDVSREVLARHVPPM
jgi:hypothetical protein